MKRFLVSMAAAVFVVGLAAAQEESPVPLIQTPYRPVTMFWPVHIELLGREHILRRMTGVSQKDSYLGCGLGLTAGYPGSLKWQIGVSLERFPAKKMGLATVDYLNFLDLQAGLRYYPNLPTIGLGRIPVRLTASVMAGGSVISAGQWSPSFKPTATLSAGLAFSYDDNPSSLMIEYVYRPLSLHVDLTGTSDLVMSRLAVYPSWAIRISWMFSGGDQKE